MFRRYIGRHRQDAHAFHVPADEDDGQEFTPDVTWSKPTGGVRRRPSMVGYGPRSVDCWPPRPNDHANYPAWRQMRAFLRSLPADFWTEPKARA